MTSKINGQITHSQTILRLCVDDACFPFRFMIAAVVGVADFVAVAVGVAVVISILLPLVLHEYPR